jgi:hypothetical protein
MSKILPCSINSDDILDDEVFNRLQRDFNLDVKNLNDYKIEDMLENKIEDKG